MGADGAYFAARSLPCRSDECGRNVSARTRVELLCAESAYSNVAAAYHGKAARPARFFPRTAAAKSAVSAVGTDNADASDACVPALPGDAAQASAVVSDAQKSSCDGCDASENAGVADMPGSESSGAV